MPGMGSALARSMAMKDVCDLQPRATHRRPAKRPVAASRRSVVRAGRVGWLRPGSWYWRHGCKAPWCRVWHDPGASESREYPHLARLRHDGEPARQVRPVERHREEEAQGRDRAVDARWRHADPRLVQLKET